MLICHRFFDKCRKKKGAHKEEYIYDFESDGALSVEAVEQMYGGEDFYRTTAIVTMAPELDPEGQVRLMVILHELIFTGIEANLSRVDQCFVFVI